ncbi:hypothetical protein MRX96_023533 [Rhipicephalus microplus]
MNAAPGRDEALSENRGQPPAPDSNRRRPQQPAAGVSLSFCEPALGCATKHRSPTLTERRLCFTRPR